MIYSTFTIWQKSRTCFSLLIFAGWALVLRHINYIEIMILAVHRYSGRPILVRQLDTLDIRLLQLKNY